MATKSTALPGVMAGSTVGTGTVKPQAPAAPTPAKKPVPAKPKTPTPSTPPKTTTPQVTVATIVSTIEDPATGDIKAVYSDGTTKILTYGTKIADDAAIARKTATTTQAIIKTKLAELQIPTSIIDSSTAFITSLVNDGVDVLSAVDTYYNNKSWTTKEGTVLNSPFYAEYTYLQESAPKTGNPPSPLEIMQFKMGVKNLVTQYGRSELFASDDALKNYISNGVKLTDLDTRFAEANLLSASADPSYVAALQKMGYISSSQDLADFYADSKIGQAQFEINKNTALFARQAMLRSGAGITVDATKMKAIAANVPGGTTGSAEQIAAAGYATIAEQLQPLTKLEGIYNKDAALQSKLTPEIQSQLEAEQFQGLASELRKKRIEQEQLSFQRKSGTIGASRLSQGSLGTTSTIGSL